MAPEKLPPSPVPSSPAQPPPDQAERIVQQTVNQLLSKSTVDALLNVQDEDLITADSDRELIKSTENGSGCWYHAPARLALFAAADKRLTRIAQLAGLKVKQVDRVDMKLIKGTKLLVIKAATQDSLATFLVNRYPGKTAPSINVITLTGPEGLTAETGYRFRYDVGYVPKESPLWPALVIDLSKPLERRVDKKRSGKKQTTEGQTEEAAKTAAADNKPSA